MKPADKIKEIEKCCNGKHKLCRAKLSILKEWEAREKEILEMISLIKYKYHNHPTANFSNTFICGLDEGLNELRSFL